MPDKTFARHPAHVDLIRGSLEKEKWNYEIFNKKAVSLILCLLIVASLVACGGGSGDALKGTWKCEDADYGEVTWTFIGSGKCSLTNDFMDADGTYTIDGSQVSITLDLWGDEPVLYDFVVTDTSLSLTTDSLASNYELTKD